MSARKRQQMKRQADRINKNYSNLMGQISGPMTERTMTEILSAFGTRINFYAPLDTAALINSQFRRVYNAPGGVIGQIGYTVNYAAALNDRTDWTPQQPSERPSGTGGYNPNAQPGYMQQGVGEAVARDLPTLLGINYKL